MVCAIDGLCSKCIGCAFAFVYVEGDRIRVLAEAGGNIGNGDTSMVGGDTH